MSLVGTLRIDEHGSIVEADFPLPNNVKSIDDIANLKEQIAVLKSKYGGMHLDEARNVSFMGYTLNVRLEWDNGSYRGATVRVYKSFSLPFIKHEFIVSMKQGKNSLEFVIDHDLKQKRVNILLAEQDPSIDVILSYVFSRREPQAYVNLEIQVPRLSEKYLERMVRFLRILRSRNQKVHVNQKEQNLEDIIFRRKLLSYMKKKDGKEEAYFYAVALSEEKPVGYNSSLLRKAIHNISQDLPSYEALIRLRPKERRKKLSTMRSRIIKEYYRIYTDQFMLKTERCEEKTDAFQSVWWVEGETYKVLLKENPDPHEKRHKMVEAHLCLKEK